MIEYEQRSPSDYLESTASTPFNMTALIEDFASVCTDFHDDLMPNNPSLASEFSSRVISAVYPQTNQPGDKIWTFHFPSNKSAIVSTKLKPLMVFI